MSLEHDIPAISLHPPYKKKNFQPPQTLFSPGMLRTPLPQDKQFEKIPFHHEKN